MTCLLLLFFCIQIDTTSCSEPKFPQLRPQPVGLPNIGNSCFMNTALQMLASLDIVNLNLINTPEARIKGYFSERLERVLKSEQGQSKQLVEKNVAFYQHYYEFAQLYQREASSFLQLSEPLYQFFKDLDSIFVLKEQGDAEEFFTQVLNTLEAASDFKANLFQWDLRQHTSVKRVEEQEKNIFWIPLDPPQNSDAVSDSFFKQHPSAQSYIPFKETGLLDEAFFMALRNVTMRNVLMITKPAFYLFCKVNAVGDCTFPLTLTFPENFIKNAPELSYELRSIAWRSGTSDLSGHYKALVRYGATWWEANDDRCTQVSLETVAQMAREGKWGSFQPRLFCYECRNLEIRMGDYTHKKFLQEKNLEQFMQQLNLIALCASSNKASPQS